MVWRFSSYTPFFKEYCFSDQGWKFFFLANFRLKMFLWKFLHHVRHLRWNVFGCCYSNFGASLWTLKPNMTPITLYRNVICIENNAGAVFLATILANFDVRRKVRILYDLFYNIKLYCIYKLSTQIYIWRPQPRFFS